MALDAEVLAEMAYQRYSDKIKEAFPEAVKSRIAQQMTLDDGTVETQFVEETGPLEVERKDIMPLLSALSEAIVEHITQHAEVQDVASGSLTRNVT